MNLDQYYQKIDLYCLSKEVEEQEAKIKQSFLHQFDYYKKKINQAVNIMRAEEQVQTYSIIEFMSSIWKKLVRNEIPTTVHFSQNSNDDKIDLLCEKIRNVQIHHNKIFKQMYGQDIKILRFPIKSEEGSKANQILQNMFVKKQINVVIGVLDLIEAFKKLSKLQQDQYIQLLLFNILIQNRDEIDAQAYSTSYDECKLYSSVLQGKFQAKVNWNGIPIDVQTLKNYITTSVNKQKIFIEKNNKYLDQSKQIKKLISQISTNYDNSIQCEEQIKKIIQLQILYFKMINQYNNLFIVERENKTLLPAIQQKHNIFNTLLNRLNQKSIDFSFAAQIKVQLQQFKSQCFLNLVESNNLNNIGQSEYCLFGESKGWCFKWRTNNKKCILHYNYKNNQIFKEDNTRVVEAKTAIQKRNSFKQKLTQIFQKNADENLNSVITQIYLIFLYQLISKYIEQIKNDQTIKQI